MFRKLTPFIVLFLIAGNVYSQDLNETLQRLSKDAASSYVSPVISAFGGNLNSGWVHRAPKSEIWGVDIEVGAVAMGTFFNDQNKTFSSSGTFRFSYEQADKIIPTKYNGVTIPTSDRNALVLDLTKKDISVGISGPTVVGKKSDSVKIVYAGDKIYYKGNELSLNKNVTLPVTGYLEELPALPLAAPQLTIGTLYGTMVSIRYLPSIKIDDKLGEFKYFGFGIQHNFSMWLPFPMPLEVSAASSHKI